MSRSLLSILPTMLTPLRIGLVVFAVSSSILLDRTPVLAQISRPQAQTVTVRIDRPNGENGGSGVLVKREGNRYTVLTNCHVLQTQKPFDSKFYPISGTYHLEINGDRYPVSITTPRCHPDGIDLALIEFESNRDYTIPPQRSETDLEQILNDSNIVLAGFSNVVTEESSNLRQPRTFHYIPGSWRSSRLTENGYNLQHTAAALNGMSGGPIFDSAGRLVAIHGETVVISPQVTAFAAIPLSYYTNWQNTTPESLGANIRADSNQSPQRTLEDLDPVGKTETEINKRSEELLQRAVDRSSYDIIGAIEMAEAIPEGTSGSEQARLYLEFWREVAGVAPSPSTPTSIEPYTTVAPTSFYCSIYDNNPTVFASHPVRGEVPIISVRSSLTQNLCNQIADNFNRTQSNGLLRYMLEGRFNNQKAICASVSPPTSVPINCTGESVLVLLPNDTNVGDIIEELNEFNLGSREPVLLSGAGVADGFIDEADRNTTATPTRFYFYCSMDEDDNNPTVFVSIPEAGEEATAWIILGSALNSSSTQSRCNQIADNFNRAVRNGLLQYLVEGRFNNQKAICASVDRPTDDISICNGETILILLSNNANVQEIISEMNDRIGNYRIGGVNRPIFLD